MRVLLVKLTSMGDLIHALPAITDAVSKIPGLSFDWVIEKNFSEIATWHPAVRNIIPTSHRRWRKAIIQSIKNKEIQHFVKAIRHEKYDLVIDGQSSIKSAVASLLARGTRCGLDKHSARESIAHWAYQKKYGVDKSLHAIQRLRLLFANVFNYSNIESSVNYGINHHIFPKLSVELPAKYIVFVHNATWQTKLYPISSWQRLIEMAKQDDLHVLLPWGNAAEKERAIQIKGQHENTMVLPFCNLSEQASILKNSQGAICSDTGLAHLAAALNIPAVTLYGPTNPQLIGTIGSNQKHFIAPFSCTLCYKRHCYYDNRLQKNALCLSAIQPENIWGNFKKIII